MTKTLDDWILECEQRLSLQPKAIREAIAPVFFRLQVKAPALLGSSKLSSKKAISKVVKPLSLLAQTQAELTVTASAFELIYDYHYELNSELIAPTSILPLQPERPLINDATPSLGIIESLRCGLYAACPYSQGTKHETDARYLAAVGQAVLLVGFRAGLTRMAELLALLNVDESEWVTLSCESHSFEDGVARHDSFQRRIPIDSRSSDEFWVSAYLPALHRRVYLRQEAILALHRARAQVQVSPPRQRKKQVRLAVLAWRDHWSTQVAIHQRQAIASLSAAELVRYIGFLDNSAGVGHLWSQNSALDHPTFIRSFIGTCIDSGIPVSARNRTAKNGQSIVWQSHAQSVEAMQQAKAVARYVRQLLAHYQSEDKKERRSGSAYQQAKHAFDMILQDPTAWAVALCSQWIASLFMYGSAWKEKLAVGTLLTYHSTVQRFVAAAWHGIDIMTVSEHEFEAYCQVGLDQFENAEEQYTVARFLRFCQQYSNFPLIDLDIFDVVSSQGVVRAHYVPPAMFDDICEQFGEQGGAYERKIIVFMQLCYYMGLREDEALSLKLRDIDFNTDFLYITNEKKRKTDHAVRKIPLTLAPTFIITQWAGYIDEQQALLGDVAYEQRPLFSHWAFSALESQFIDFARRYLKDGAIVTHSFRHCAANNWVCLLAMLAFKGRAWPTVYFMQHVLFSKAQLEALNATFDLHGQHLTPHFFILDWVAEKLGHASPATAWTSYWHWIDWVSLIVTYPPYEVKKSQVRFWTSGSNYGFERQKQLFQSPNDRSLAGILAPWALREWVSRHWKIAQHHHVDTESRKHDRLDEDKSTVHSSPLSFSRFVVELEKLMVGGEETSCSAELVQWLAQSKATPLCFRIEPNQEHAWLRVCLQADKWRTYPRKRLRRMYAHLKKAQCLLTDKNITRYRDLQCLLSVYGYLNLQPLTIKIQAREESTSAQNWQQLIERYGAHCVREESTSKTQASIRPYRLQWTLWSQVSSIIALLIDYLDWYGWDGSKDQVVLSEMGDK
ncbi:site-specific integrase [Vibrio alginolyticus]|uniref:site-specific integrase n=1 Tax=Vibrio alginolyticus TaxID=663 RepID=UPI001BD4263E|nr:site-specific integrase [Vibrio alginolyticus]MBS9811353.1 site-specific integrase [Vibrio alginolyticus]